MTKVSYCSVWGGFKNSHVRHIPRTPFPELIISKDHPKIPLASIISSAHIRKLTYDFNRSYRLGLRCKINLLDINQDINILSTSEFTVFCMGENWPNS